MRPLSLMIVILAASAIPQILPAQPSNPDVYAGEFTQVAVDRDGVLYALPKEQHGVLRGRLPVVENIGPDSILSFVHVTAQGLVFAGAGGAVYRRESGGDWSLLPLSPAVSRVVSDSTGILYAASQVGSSQSFVWKSTDDGETWSSSLELADRLDFLVASPRGEVYVCSYRNTYVSTDGGGTWTAPAPIPGALTRAILFTGEGEPVVASEYTKLYYYSDSAGGWVEPPRTIPRLHITDFAAVPPRDGVPMTLYGCNAIGDIIRSRDSGATWELLVYGGDYPTGILNGIAADEEYLYVAAQKGLWRLRHDDLAFERYGTTSTVAGTTGAQLGLWISSPVMQAPRLRFNLPVAVHLTVAVYDVRGRLLRTLLDEQHSAGEGTLIIDVPGLAAGVYICRMNAGGTKVDQKIVLLR